MGRRVLRGRCEVRCKGEQAGVRQAAEGVRVSKVGEVGGTEWSVDVVSSQQ